MPRSLARILVANGMRLWMLNIVIPMAGLGSRFRDAGYILPKPLIPIHGVPMIKLVISNIRPRCEHTFTFICQKRHVLEHDLRTCLSSWAPNCNVVEIDGLTEGAACTVLCGRDAIADDNPLMVANSDQFVDFSIDEYLSAMDGPRTDGLIMTMKATDPKWSFVEVGPDDCVTRVAEKVPISDNATVGVYNFASGREFVRSADAMISKNLRVNGEFYVAPVYNQFIGDGAKIRICDIGSGMHGLGTPLDLTQFLQKDISRRATEATRCKL